MLRYVAALAVIVLLPPALADDFFKNRDANLASINTACLLVVIQAGEPDMTQASVAAAKSHIMSELAKKAVLYSVPIKGDCTAEEINTLPLVALYFHVVGAAMSYRVNVVLQGSYSGYANPDVWLRSGLMSSPGGITPKDIRDEAPKLFDDFALAWKNEHPQ